MPSLGGWAFDVERWTFYTERKTPDAERPMSNAANTTVETEQDQHQSELRWNYRGLRGNEDEMSVPCGDALWVTLAAVVTFTLAIPATNDHWRAEIVNRGGAAWYFDKDGKVPWMWTAQPATR